jgi:LysM repeat protein
MPGYHRPNASITRMKCRVAPMEAMASRTYDGGKKGSRFFARIVALLALGAVSVVIVVVVSHSLDSGTSAKTTTHIAKTHHKPSPPPDKCYTVQSGDTFTNIAKSEGVIQRQLIKRNGGAGFDPESLQPGQPINIVPDGCK